MPFSFGMVAMPVSLLMLVLRQKGPVQMFVKAGALSPETARRPASVGVESQYMIDPLVRSGVLRATGDGRFYADPAAVRRRRRLFTAGAAILGIIGVSCALLLLWDQGGGY